MSSAHEVPVVSSVAEFPLLWKVHRCGVAKEDPEYADRACGVGEVGPDGEFTREVVGDTNRDECCHHMRLSDAEEIVAAHNNLPALIKVKGDITPEKFAAFKKQWLAEYGAVSARMIVRDADDTLNPTEAIYGFVSWLTTRAEVTKFGASEDCAPAVDLIKKFIETNQLSEVSARWPHNLKHPKDE